MTTGFVINHLWQSSCGALLAGLLALALRKNSPKVRYWVWLSASLKFLVPLALLVNLGGMIKWPAQRAISDPPPAFASTLIQMAEPFAPPSYSAAPAPTAVDWAPIAISVLWALGFAAITFVRCRSWFRIKAALRLGTPAKLPIPIPAFIVRGAEEPGIVGFLRPVLVLPAKLVEHLNPRQLDAVLAHELCHARRRDNLFAGVHMLVEAIFWFHPLVWWIGSRMVEERELACDEEVLLMGHEATDYVEGILNVCRFHKESPLRCVSGVTGADVKKRLRAILEGSIAHKLSLGRKVALAAIGVATLTGPIVVGALNAPSVHAQSSQPAVAPASPTFEVATVKLTPEGYFGGTGLGGGPGQLTIRNYTLRQMMKYAYTLHPDQILSAPGWTDIIRYDVEAKLPQGVGGETNIKLMIQKLMADRFGLSFHRETREMSAYALTVANGGPKMRERKDGDGGPGYSQYFNGPRLPAKKTSMAQLAMGLQGLVLDRPVLDRTGLSGAYDFDLSWSPDETQFSGRGGTGLNVGDPNGPSIYTALEEQLGLKLSSVKAPVEVLIVDRVEKPSEN